jgi:hypothetical protein
VFCVVLYLSSSAGVLFGIQNLFCWKSMVFLVMVLLEEYGISCYC